MIYKGNYPLSTMLTQKHLTRLSDNLWEIPMNVRSNMLVPARVYASPAMLEEIFAERALEQLINMTTLPGIEKYALAMPDIHQGYGFPIGGVAAFRLQNGIISPGGVGYDINCGVRLLTSPHSYEEIKHKITALINQIQRDVPSGVGSSSNIVLNFPELDKVLNSGIKWALKNGYALPEDVQCIEEQGCYKIADAAVVSKKAKERGRDQLGTLGAGNHFLEIQKVVAVYDEKIAQTFGIFQDQITIMIHTGSRGLGHQICTDYVQLMNKNIPKFGINLVDRELACAPFESEEGQQYLRAMAAAANFAWVNRQVISDSIRQVWTKVLGEDKSQLSLLYDVAHNIAKIETYENKKFIVHRKGATRAFAPHHPELPDQYKTTGQPVIIPGSMGTYSYVLAGTQEAIVHSFGSTCHGAGRRMSRMKAKKTVSYRDLQENLEKQGITVRAGSIKGLVEEAPEAYKDIDDVVAVVDAEKIAHKVAKLKPIAVVKG